MPQPVTTLAGSDAYLGHQKQDVGEFNPSRPGARDAVCALPQGIQECEEEAARVGRDRGVPAGLDIGYVPAGPDAFFRWSGQFGPQQLIFSWPAGPVDFFFYFFFLFFFIFFRITIHICKFLRGWLLNNLIIGLC